MEARLKWFANVFALKMGKHKKSSEENNREVRKNEETY
jgi:hypothetical protein